jgi:hypothetical protein
MEIFKKWENAKIFSTGFYNKLRDLAVTILLFRTQYSTGMFNKKRQCSKSTPNTSSSNTETHGR